MSNVIILLVLGFPYILSYKCLLVAYGPSRLIYELCLKNLSDIDFDLLMSLKGKCDSTIGPPYMISYWCLMA